MTILSLHSHTALVIDLAIVGAVLVVTIVVALRSLSTLKHQRVVLERRIAQRTRDLMRGRYVTSRIVDSIDDGIVVVSDGRIVYHNDAICRILGVTTEGLSRVWPTIVDEPSVRAAYESIETPRSRRTIRYEVPDDSGSLFLELSSSTNDGDKDSVSIQVVRDVTAEVEAADLKQQFVSSVSHEIRTPLTSLVSSLHLIGSGSLGVVDDRVARLVHIASLSADRLMRLVNEVLEHRRLESGIVDLNRTTFAIGSIVDVAVSTSVCWAHERDVRLVVERPDTEPVVNADADRLTQVVVNLLSNAVKFSPAEGEVVVRYSSTWAGAVRIEVRDRCRTIPAESREVIFEMFRQLDASDSRSSSGSGLGLAICRSIVERHEGRIWVEPRRGSGNVFVVEIPATMDTAERLAIAEAS